MQLWYSVVTSGRILLLLQMFVKPVSRENHWSGNQEKEMQVTVDVSAKGTIRFCFPNCTPMGVSNRLSSRWYTPLEWATAATFVVHMMRGSSLKRLAGSLATPHLPSVTTRRILMTKMNESGADTIATTHMGEDVFAVMWTGRGLALLFLSVVVLWNFPLKSPP